MSEFHFETSGSPADGATAVDADVRSMFEDPDYDFSTQNYVPRANDNPIGDGFRLSFEKESPEETDPVDDFFQMAAEPVTAASVAPAVRSVAPATVTAAPAARRPAVTCQRPVAHQRHGMAAAAPAVNNNDVRRDYAHSDRPADNVGRRPEAVPQQRLAASAARTMDGNAFRESADKLIQSLHQQRLERERRIDQLSKEKQQLQVQLKDCRSLYETTDSENRRFVFQLKEATAALEAERQKCDEIQSLQNDLMKRIAVVERQGRTTEEFKLLLEKMNAAKEEILQKQAAHYNSHMSQVTKDMAQLKISVTDLKQQLFDANRQIEQIAAAKEQAEQELAKSMEAFDEKQADATRALQEMGAEKETLIAEKTELQSQVAGLLEKAEYLQSECDEQQLTLSADEQEISDLTKQLQQLSAERDAVERKCSDLDGEVAELQAGMDILKENCDCMQEEFDQKLLEQSDRMATVSRDLQAACRKTEDEAADLRSEVQRLTIQLQQTESAKEAAVSRCEQLVSELETVEQKVVQLQTEMALLNEQLSSSKGRSESDLEAAEQRKLAAEQRVAALEAEKLVKDDQLKQKDEELHQVQESIARLVQEGDQQNGQMTRFRSERNAAEAEREKVKEQLHEVMKGKAQLELKGKVWQQEEEKLRLRLKEKETQIDAKNEEIESLTAKVAHFEQQKVKETTPVVNLSPPKRKAGRRALKFDENGDDDDDTEEEDDLQQAKRLKQTPAKKQAEKKVPEKKGADKKQSVEKKKPVAEKKKQTERKGSEKKQEDVYRKFADASAGDCAAPRRKLPVASNSSVNQKDEQSDFEWF